MYEFSCTLCTDPAPRNHYECIMKSVDDADEYATAATRGRSASSLKWATTMHRSCMTVTNGHPFALHDLVVRDGAPVSEDEKRICVVLRHPVGLAELEQKGELRFGAEESE